MRLSEDLLHTLANQKRVELSDVLSTTFHKSAEKSALDRARAKVETPALKAKIAKLQAQWDKLEAQSKKLRDEIGDLAKSIEDDSDKMFYWTLRDGFRQNLDYSPINTINHKGRTLISKAVTDLRIACLGLSGEQVRAAVSAFVNRDFAAEIMQVKA